MLIVLKKKLNLYSPNQKQTILIKKAMDKSNKIENLILQHNRNRSQNKFKRNKKMEFKIKNKKKREKKLKRKRE